MESVSVRLFDAIARQDLDAVRAELAGGVDRHSVNTDGETLIVAAHRTMLSSEPRVAWEIMAAILDAGYQPTELEACLVAPLNSQYQQWEPDFLAIMEQLNQIFSEHQRDYLAPGTQLFAGWKGSEPERTETMNYQPSRWMEQDERLLKHRHQDLEVVLSPIMAFARRSGFVTMLGGRLNKHDWSRFNDRGRVLHLFPTADPYEAVALIGLGDWEETPPKGPEQLIPELKLIEAHWPFHIRSCTGSRLEFEFLTPLRDAEDLIRELKCSFFIDGWYTSEEIMTSSRQLNGQRRLSVKFGLM